MLPSLADFIYHRVSKLRGENLLVLPLLFSIRETYPILVLYLRLQEQSSLFSVRAAEDNSKEVFRCSFSSFSFSVRDKRLSW